MIKKMTIVADNTIVGLTIIAIAFTTKDIYLSLKDRLIVFFYL